MQKIVEEGIQALKMTGDQLFMGDAPLQSYYEGTCGTRALERKVAELKLEVSSLKEKLAKVPTKVDSQDVKICQLTIARSEPQN